MTSSNLVFETDFGAAREVKVFESMSPLLREPIAPSAMGIHGRAAASSIRKLFKNHSRAAGSLMQRGWLPSRVEAVPFQSAGKVCCAYLESCGPITSFPVSGRALLPSLARLSTMIDKWALAVRRSY